MLAQSGGFWPDWALFGDAILVGTLLAMVLPLGGALLVLRQQVFVTAAIGQAATLGFAVALVLGLGSAHDLGHSHGRAGLVGCGMAAAVLTAIAALRALSARQSTMEARSAFVFLFAGSAAMLLLDRVPHGPQVVQHLFLSSLLTVAPSDVWLVLVGAVVSLLGLRWRRRLLLWAIDPATAEAHGSKALHHDLVVGTWLGLWLGYAIVATGLVFTFGASVLPVLAVRSWVRSLWAALLLAPLLGGAGLLAGFVLAHRFDLPPGQVFVALLGTVAAAARLLARR